MTPPEPRPDSPTGAAAPLLAAATFGAEWSAGLRRGSEPELDAWLRLALELADLADRLARTHFRRDLEIETKPDRTYVTQADRAIEAAVRERIEAAYPDHGLVGEEYGETAAGAPVRWYIDPIDGTANFVRGIPIFGFLLALERDGELQLGVVSMPILGERWFARRGGGAWALETRGPAAAPRRIGVSRVERIEDAQLVYGSASHVAATGQAAGFRALIERAWRDRGFGDCWGYALVADGAAEAMIEADLKSWDLAAPALLVEEAGGRLTDLAGVRTIHGGSGVASNGLLHDAILTALTAEPA